MKVVFRTSGLSIAKANPNHDQLGRFACGPGMGGGRNGNAAEPPLIQGVTPVAVDSRNYGEIAKREFEKLQKKIKEGLFCSALDGRRVAGIKTRKHLKETKGKRRVLDDVLRRVAIMPFIIPVIKKGIAEKRENEKGVSYRVYGKNEQGKEVSVILIEDKKTRLLYFSVFDNEEMMKKSIPQGGDLTPGGVPRFPFTPWKHGLLSPDHTFIIPDITEKSTEKMPNSGRKPSTRLGFRLDKFSFKGEVTK